MENKIVNNLEESRELIARIGGLLKRKNKPEIVQELKNSNLTDEQKLHLLIEAIKENFTSYQSTDIMIDEETIFVLREVKFSLVNFI